MLCTVLLALSAAATSSAQSQQPHKGQDQSSEASSPNGQTDSANSQAAPTGSLSIAAHHEAGAVHIENGPPANERQTAAQERTARYTCWIVIFTAVMAV